MVAMVASVTGRCRDRAAAVADEDLVAERPAATLGRATATIAGAMPAPSAMHLDAVWHTAVGTRVPTASWSLREGDAVLTAHDPERRFSSASMIKTFLLAVALEQVQRGRLALDAPVVVAPERRTDGDGVLCCFQLPIALPLRELLVLMIALSDNTATNAVIDAVGGLEVANDQIAGAGYEHTRLRRYVGGAGPSWSGAREGETYGLGVTSAVEHERAIAQLDAHPVARQLLEAQRDRRALARYVGEHVAFAHKTGSVDGVRHDGGLLRAGGRELLVGCFSDGGPVPEWVDHPACVGMGLALAWTTELLGIDVAPPAGTPAVPEVLVGGLSHISRAQLTAATHAEPEPERRFWLRAHEQDGAGAQAGDTPWARTILRDGRWVGLVGVEADERVRVRLHDPGAERRGTTEAALELASAVASVRGPPARP